MTQSQALDIMKTGANIFLTGEPGSGKTYVVNKYVAYLRSCGIEPAITASTGIAATHIGGMTIHSWSGVGIKSELSRYDIEKIITNKKFAKRFEETKVLIIDEISMLSANTLDLVELVCRRAKKNPEPFGGMQVIFVGDFFQLPPVNKFDLIKSQKSIFENTSERFAFTSSAWQSTALITCYLSEQYRHDDKDYLDLLLAIRTNDFNEKHIIQLEQRKINYHETPADLPKLFTHNIDVDRVNNEMLAQLNGKYCSFEMRGYGPKALVEILQRGCLSPKILELKVGASVMFTKNSFKGLFVNGTLGTVIGFNSTNDYPIVSLRDGRKLTVEPTDWVLEDNGVDVARITQFPLRLAWAITVHKSQGMSLDGAIIDLSSVFEYGQGYVALSRVRRLSGLYLIGWNNRAVKVDPKIITKDSDFRSSSFREAEVFSNMPMEDVKALHHRFIKLCGGSGSDSDENFVIHSEINDFSSLKKIVRKKTNKNTVEETLIYWREGKDLEEICKVRGLKNTTVLSHLEKLLDMGKIQSEELFKLVSEELCEVLPEIHQAFHQLETNKLAKVFSYFKGRHSFENLRLARLVLEKKLINND